MYVLTEGLSYRDILLILDKYRTGTVYYSDKTPAHLKFESAEDAIAFSLASGFKVYKEL